MVTVHTGKVSVLKAHDEDVCVCVGPLLLPQWLPVSAL